VSDYHDKLEMLAKFFVKQEEESSEDA